MDSLLITAAILTAIFVPLAVIFLLFSHFRLRRQVARLENRVERVIAQKIQTDARKTAPPSPPAKAKAARSVQPAASPWESVKTTPDPSETIAQPHHDLLPSAPESSPKTFVFNTSNFDRARSWLLQNWFLAIAALSLALAGVFLVQYGVENGLLSPFWRVMGAAILGVALIWGGEKIRRYGGDERGRSTAYLPSTFSGAGLVALFAAVLAADHLYALIGPQVALVYLILVSGVAVVLGWYYGPYLVVVGLLGSLGAPFAVGGESNAPELFYYYFAIVVLAALAVDTVKRWAWVSALALGLGYAAAWYIFDQRAGDQHFLAFALIVLLGAAMIPTRSVLPSHTGTTALWGYAKMVLPKSAKGAKEWPEFPTRLVAGALAAAGVAAMLVALKDAGIGEVWLAVITLSLIYLAVVIWLRRAKALDDLALIPAVLLLAVLVVQAIDRGSLYAVFQDGATRPPETVPPYGATIFALIGLGGSALAYWRSLWADVDENAGQRAQVWAVGAALFAPLMLVTLEIFWVPALVIGKGQWAAQAIAIAAMMVFFAQSAARRDAGDKRRVAYFTLAALTMISFALVIILSAAALTLALTVMALVAALLDWRFDLRLLGVFVQFGVIVVGWRLVLDPGMFWAIEAPIWEMSLVYVASVALLIAAWVALATRDRTNTRVIVESGVWAILGVFVSVLLNRALGPGFDKHWGISLFASVWLILMMVQLYRLQSGGALNWLRWVLAVVYGGLAAFGFFLIAVLASPLHGPFDAVVGPPVFDSLLVALVVPALVLAIGAWKLTHLQRWLRIGFIAFSALFATTYAGLEIRRLWRGRDLSVPGFSDAELYTYTLAMLLASVLVLLLAFNRRSLLLRRIATIGVALTIAKVFLIDMSGLAGLLRVASFLGLGLSLAALGWLYSYMSARWDEEEAEK